MAAEVKKTLTSQTSFGSSNFFRQISCFPDCGQDWRPAHQNVGFRRPTARRAFTLIELLVAISIMALLVAIGIGVGRKLSNQGKIKATKANMALIMNAIDTFHDEFGVPPGDTSLQSDRTRTFREEINTTDTSASSHLWGYTERTNYTPPKSRDKLKNLPKKVIGTNAAIGTGVNVSITFDFQDSFGNVMRYSANGGLGGTPVLFSAGTDGRFGNVKDSNDDWISSTDPDEREEYAKDDIRSDK